MYSWFKIVVFFVFSLFWVGSFGGCLMGVFADGSIVECVFVMWFDKKDDLLTIGMTIFYL